MTYRVFQQLQDKHEQETEEHAHQKTLSTSRVRALAHEPQQKHRDRSRERKIANSWVPGQKRVRLTCTKHHPFADNLYRNVSYLLRTRTTSTSLHPWLKTHALVATSKKTNGRKTNQQAINELMNMSKRKGLSGSVLSYGNKSTMLPLKLESHGHPVSLLTRRRKEILLFSRSFRSKVLGRWVDPVAKKHGVSKWKDSVLEQVKKGNSPRGETTQAGIFVRYQPLPTACF